METETIEELLTRIESLESRLAEANSMIEAIKAGEVDAFAVKNNGHSKIYTLQTGDYAYRILVEHFGEGALNLSEDGLIVYTNTYFLQLLGLPYDNVVGKPVTDFIHHRHEEAFRALFSKGLAGQSKGELLLFANNRTIPVYVSLTSLYPQLPTVGMIVTDLTEKKKNEERILQYQRDLESKNQELMRNNAELASFSYIASHDLQEPLRKIQTFSGRILDTEMENLSLTTQDYFRRIKGAGARMQNLIADLLSYSRTNTTERVFVTTDLNQVVEEVKTNLAELIAEKDAMIKTAPLPHLKVVPLHFVQLFTNLILNSIKYRREGVSPEISISANIAPLSEVKKNDTSQNKCWEITFRDNGIGFEQQHADRIFELFQRLHSREEYEGTGIGLAICKKIVEQHNGFIKAEGTPGVGAAFRIYMPIVPEDDGSKDTAV